MRKVGAPDQKPRATVAREPFDAARKLSYLVRDVIPRRVLGHQPSMASFSAATGIARSTLRVQLKEGRLTGHVQAILAEKLGFSLGWDEWVAGTAEEFSGRYSLEHQRESVAELSRFDKNGATRRTGTRQEVEDERTGVQFLVSRPCRPWSIHEMISVQMFFQQTGKGTQWPFDMEIVCQKARLPELDIAVAISRASVRVSWDRGLFPSTRASRARDRETKLGTLEGTLSERKIEAAVFGDETAPGWELSHTEGKHLGVISLDSACDLFCIEDGLQVMVTLMVYDKDLNAEVTNAAIAEAPEVDGDGGLPAIVRADGQSLGTTKLKVLKAIAARSLKQHPKQPAGSAILASDCVTFKKR